MPPKTLLNKKTITILTALLIITLLREAGIIDFNYYKSESRSTSNHNWSDNSTKITLAKSKVNWNATHRQFSKLPIVVVSGDDTLYKESSELSPITIEIEQIETEFLWIPLVKPATFSVIGRAEYSINMTKVKDDKLITIQPQILGKLNITGDISIYGICSRRNGIKIIRDMAVKSFVDETRRYFSTLD